MGSKQQLPDGIRKFQETLINKVKDAYTDHATINCELCNVEMPLNKMNVFVYPDAPFYTTKALCLKCCKQEYMNNQSAYTN